MHLPAAMDGGPHQPIAPGTTLSPQWTIDQPAATLWYHQHPHGETAQHVYRGLAGMFLVTEPGSGLPDEYGVDDFLVIVQDNNFRGDGALDERESLLGGVGVLGDTIAVNGTIGPYLDVRHERVRLRLLNGSNARIYDFGFADDREFSVVGTDGGLLPRPEATDRVTLSPGERAEILVTMRPGKRVVLRSTPPPVGLNGLSARSPARPTRWTSSSCGLPARSPRPHRWPRPWPTYRGCRPMTPCGPATSGSPTGRSTANGWT